MDDVIYESEAVLPQFACVMECTTYAQPRMRNEWAISRKWACNAKEQAVMQSLKRTMKRNLPQARTHQEGAKAEYAGRHTDCIGLNHIQQQQAGLNRVYPISLPREHFKAQDSAPSFLPTYPIIRRTLWSENPHRSRSRCWRLRRVVGEIFINVMGSKSPEILKGSPKFHSYN